MNEAIYPSRVPAALLGLNRGWTLSLGILMVVLGVIGLGMTYSIAVAVVFWCGIFAMISGIGHIVDAIYHRAWQGVVWHIVVGVVFISIGIALTMMPSASAFWLTKFIALGLVLNGASRLVLLFQIRENRVLQVLLLVFSAVSIGLGVYVYTLVASPDPEVFATAEAHADWARSWKWVIGFFVAIELLTEGLSLISISLSRKPAHGD